MTINEIMEKIREGLTGEYSVDMVYLESQADKYRSAKNAKEIESAIADLAYEILPDDKREVLNKMMYIDGKRLDVVFAEANKLIQEKKIDFLIRQLFHGLNRTGIFPGWSISSICTSTARPKSWCVRYLTCPRWCCSTATTCWSWDVQKRLPVSSTTPSAITP